jgi:hypothetical protein
LFLSLFYRHTCNFLWYIVQHRLLYKKTYQAHNRSTYSKPPSLRVVKNIYKIKRCNGLKLQQDKHCKYFTKMCFRPTRHVLFILFNSDEEVCSKILSFLVIFQKRPNFKVWDSREFELTTGIKQHTLYLFSNATFISLFMF